MYGISGVKYERIDKSNTGKYYVNGQIVLRQKCIFLSEMKYEYF